MCLIHIIHLFKLYMRDFKALNYTTIWVYIWYSQIGNIKHKLTAKIDALIVIYL